MLRPKAYPEKPIPTPHGVSCGVVKTLSVPALSSIYCLHSTHVCKLPRVITDRLTRLQSMIDMVQLMFR